MDATAIGSLLGYALLVLPFMLVAAWPSLMDFIVEWRHDRRPDVRAGRAVRDRAFALEEAELARRKAVEAHRASNEAEHILWLHHFEADGTTWFCSDCGFPHRRHWATCHKIASGITVAPNGS